MFLAAPVKYMQAKSRKCVKSKQSQTAHSHHVPLRTGLTDKLPCFGGLFQLTGSVQVSTQSLDMSSALIPWDPLT